MTHTTTDTDPITAYLAGSAALLRDASAARRAATIALQSARDSPLPPVARRLDNHVETTEAQPVGPRVDEVRR